MTPALSDRCARTGGPYGTGPCLAGDAFVCPYCQLAATRIPPPTREEPPREQRP